MFAGFAATCVVSPIDVVKTRIMNARSSGGEGTSAFRVVADLARSQGVRGFFRGFVPSLIRVGGFNVVFFLVVEQTRGLIQGMRKG